jgi:glutathione S-transferase
MAASSARMMKLHGSKSSTNYQRAWIYMAEKGLSFEPVMVDMMAGEHKSAAFLKINPRGQIPCLVDGDAIVYESTAIIQYLERKYPTPALLPTNDADLAVSLTRQAEFLAKMDDKNVIGSIVFKSQGIAELGDRATKLFNELQVWDGYLENKEYLAGSFSIADIYVFPFVAPYYHLCKLPIAKFPNLGAWYERVKNRSAMKDCEYFNAVEKFAAAVGATDVAVFADVK